MSKGPAPIIHKPHGVDAGSRWLLPFHNPELAPLYFETVAKTLARSLVFVFVPIYLLQLGFSLRDIALFEMVQFAGMAFATPLGLWLCSKIGIKRTMAFADALLILYLLCIMGLSLSPSFIFISPIIFALSAGIFWAGYHVDFTLVHDHNAEGKEISFINALSILANALGPALGSIIIFRFSYIAAYAFAIGLCIVAIIPLIRGNDRVIPAAKFSWKKLTKVDTPAKALAYVGFGYIEVCREVYWPLLIYITVQSVLDVGITLSVTTLFAVVFVVIYLGRLVDRRPKRALFMGTVSQAPTWIARLLWLTPFGILITNFFGMITYMLLDTAHGKIVYQGATQSGDLANYFLFRIIFVALGNILVCAVAFWIGSLSWVVGLAALATFFYLPLLLRKSLKN